MDEHSVFFYLLILILVIGVLQSVSIGGLFLLKRTGVRRANQFYGLLLITIGLTLLHNIFIMTDFYKTYRYLYFLPIYFTLAFPTLLFYYVKFDLYPNYRLRWTDAKHFLLPIGQWLFFIWVFVHAADYKTQFERYFYNPFYGAFEQFLYLTTFFAYLYFAFRYVRARHRQLKKSDSRKLFYLRTLLQVLFVLFCVHTLFVVADFFTYEFLNINLRSVKVYAALGALSFAALVFWLGIYGFQVLFWGPRAIRESKQVQ